MSNMQNNKDIEVGDIAPDFELMDTNQDSHKLSEYNKDGLTILAFFPAAGSPVCTVELCNFRDSINDLEVNNVKILGISVDSPFANKVFAEHHNFNFPLLSDYDREIIKKYNVVMPNLGKLKDFEAAKRSIFVIDGKLKVIYRWVSDNPLIEPNYEEIKKITMGR